MAPRKSQITVTDRADGAKNAAVELARRNPALAKRLAGNPFGSGSRAIPLKEPQRWQVYIENTYVDEGAFLRMREKGWVPLTEEDLSCTVDESGFRKSADGYLVRGPQGQEMVWKMDVDDYRLLTQAKTDANLRGIGSRSKIKRDLEEAGAAQFGDEGASYISQISDGVVDRIGGAD
jgi:hypothetical protein